jgi:hypothetical protein
MAICSGALAASCVSKELEQRAEEFLYDCEDYNAQLSCAMCDVYVC